MHRAAIVLVAALALSGSSAPGARGQSDGRDPDRAAIRAHIESICQAFIDGDIEKLHATHTEDWRGFLGNDRAPIKGIDEYMKANGLPWPPPANVVRRPANPTRTFRVFEFDVHFYSPDIAVANFFVDFGDKVGDTFRTGTRYRIMDIYVRRKGEWNQAASHTVVDPVWAAERQTLPATLPPPVRDQLLSAREAVWRAYFTNDQAQLEKLVPADTIVMDGPIDKPFVRQPEILEGAKRQAQSGATLVKLEFPQTEIQVYGQTAIIYTTYAYELKMPDGASRTSSGKATEIFVRRNGAWVNPGWLLAPAAK